MLSDPAHYIIIVSLTLSVSQASMLLSVSPLVALLLDSIVVFNIVVAILLPGSLFCTVNDLRK